MLRKISDSINHCVKCDDETKRLIWAFNQDLILEPVCWRCFERADKRINVRPGWTRTGRNKLILSQPVYADGKQNDRRSGLSLVQKSGVENQIKRQIPATAQAAYSNRELAKAA